jgi:tight adherence protein B
MATLLSLQVWAGRAHQAELRRLSGLLSNGQAIAPPAKTGEIALPGFVTRRLARAGWTPNRRAITACVAGLAMTAALSWVYAGPLAATLAVLTLLLLGLAVLEYYGTIRTRRLSECMLGFLERIRQLLTIGNSLAVALERAVHNSPPAVADALAPTLRRIANGGGVADSLELSAAELGLYELHLLATAARANLRFGGSLAATLKNMIENIRRRASIERELRSNTSQIRASAWVLALLPLLVASLVTLTNPSYSRWFLTTDKGHWMLAYAIGSQLAGVLCMRSIIRTRY